MGNDTCSLGDGHAIMARGWCSTHYQKWLRFGDPEGRQLDPEIPGERWMPIPAFPGYEASSTGRIRNIRGSRLSSYKPRVLSLTVGGQGYLGVTLWRDKRPSHQMVHRLVAAAFLGPRPADLVVRHLNDVTVDNRIANLAYGTRTENKLDSLRNGIHPSQRQTHCAQGHEYTPENTYWRPDKPTHRRCRECMREERRRRTAKARAARPMPEIARPANM